jgi:NhaA family Na+:H+ antiporter
MHIPPRALGRARVRADISALPGGLTLPLQRYIHSEEAGGLMLMLGAIIGLVWVNTPLARLYEHLWHAHRSLNFQLFRIDLSLHGWVNDGLMVLFFLLIGIEIKREMVRGELSTGRKAMLPIIAALGGMILPAALYVACTATRGGLNGWGIPVATDIAFALGVLALLGPRIPASLKIFLLAFATVDDIGGILIIAIFYTEKMAWFALALAGALVIAIWMLRYFRIQNPGLYGILGVLLWMATLKSGIHATIAGVALGLLMPADPALDRASYLQMLEKLSFDLRDAVARDDKALAAEILGQMEELTQQTEAPLDRLEQAIRPWVSYFVLPIFALANSGVALSAHAVKTAIASPVAQGIAVGLIVGKFIGVWAAVRLAVKLRWTSLPAGVTWSHITGTSLLAGIGFTVSLFIADLSFGDSSYTPAAKIGILFASGLSGALGYTYLLYRAPSGNRK